MNMLVSLYIWLSSLFGGPLPTDYNGQQAQAGDQQAMSAPPSSKKKSSDSDDRGLTRKGYIYNGF